MEILQQLVSQGYDASSASLVVLSHPSDSCESLAQILSQIPIKSLSQPPHEPPDSRTAPQPPSILKQQSYGALEKKREWFSLKRFQKKIKNEPVKKEGLKKVRFPVEEMTAEYVIDEDVDALAESTILNAEMTAGATNRKCKARELSKYYLDACRAREEIPNSKLMSQLAVTMFIVNIRVTRNL